MTTGMTTLHLIRHAETESNAEGRVQGHRDVALSPRGREQAAALGAVLAGWPLSAVHTSDLARATETAALIAAPHGLVAVADVRWRETDMGDWTGLVVGDIAARWPEEHARWRGGDPDFRLPGGESITELGRRAVAAFEDVVARHREETVAVVSHGLTLRHVVAHVLGVGPQIAPRVRLGNCSVTTVEVRADGRLVLCRLNADVLPPDAAPTAPDVGEGLADAPAG